LIDQTPAQWPKMLTQKIGDRVVPMHYRAGHERHGEHVIFQTEADEKAFNRDDAVPASDRPEQHSAPDPSYFYDAPWWTK
jgi:hypothetical protein